MNHTPGNLTFSIVEYEPNKYTIGSNGNWLMSIQHNGEHPTETQIANIQHLVGCWNSGMQLEWLEVTPELLSDMPSCETKYWIALKDGSVEVGKYEWWQGREPDRFILNDRYDIWAYEASHIRLYNPPTHPNQGEIE